ncbi:MAG: CheR family methyltransferase [Desulfovibrionales bacterium]
MNTVQAGERNLKVIASCSMHPKLFKEFSEIISRECGIKLPSAKKVMLESRMRKRLRDLRLNSFEEYREFFHSGERENELVHLIDVVTTNTTEFFREPRHFEILSGRVLPEWGARRANSRFKVWSAGCSSGEEPYTLAMILQEFAETMTGFRFSILGTDISTCVLQRAIRAVYPEDRARKIPERFKRKYLLRSKDRTKNLIRMAPEVRSSVTFQRLNFMEEFSLEEAMDAIFCRNVLIYFDRPTQELILNRICRHLLPGGYLFIGHSESLAGMGLPLMAVAPTVYRKAP